MNGYTKGPWNRSSLASLYIISGDDSNPICSMGEYSKRGRVETTFENAQANAHLIAAAPELLEALKEANECVRQMLIAGACEPHELNPQGWAIAISKAEGK